MAAKMLKGLSHRHDAIIDYMLVNQSMKKGEIAAELGFTAAWFSSLISSDAFKAEYERRRQEFNHELATRQTAKIFDIASHAADVVLSELTKEDEEGNSAADPRFALDAHSKAIRALGFGAPPSAQNGPKLVTHNTQINIGPATPANNDALVDARARMERVSRLTVLESEPATDPEPVSTG